MDLLDDTPLFNLDVLPEAFTHGNSDPVEEALKLALGQVDPPLAPAPAPAPAPVPQPVQVSLASAVPVAVQSAAQATIPVVSSAAQTAVLLGSPLATSQSQQSAPKIVILKGPQGQAQVLQGVAGAAAGGSPAGKLTIARVLTGTPLRPGMSIVSGGTVLNATPPAQGQVKVGTGVQRLVQSPNGPLKQVLLTSLPQAQLQAQTQVQLQAQQQVQLQTHVQPQVQLQTQLQPQAQAQVQLQAQTQQQVQLQTQTQPQVQIQTQMQTQPQVQIQTQMQPQLQLQTQTQTQSGAVRPQGVTLTTVPQQVSAHRQARGSVRACVRVCEYACVSFPILM